MFGRLWLSWLMFAACTAPPPVGESSPPSPAIAPSVGPVPCEAMTRGECMASAVCTLVQASPRPGSEYRCRPVEPPCEVEIVQATLADPGSASRAACEARAGCGVVAGGCYCHCRGAGRAAVPDGPEAPPCNCACGGGPPATCAAIDPPPPPGPADAPEFGASVAGLALGVTVGGPEFATNAPITVTLALKNTSSGALTIPSHVYAGENHLDWFALELEYACGAEVRRRRIVMIDDRDESARVEKTLAPGEVLTHQVDLRGWAGREVNGKRPIGPGSYRLSARYVVRPGEAAWAGELSAPARALTIAGTPAPELCAP